MAKHSDRKSYDLLREIILEMLRVDTSSLVVSEAGYLLAQHRATKPALILAVQQVVALIDSKLNKITNSIIHSREFQKLEASWRGLNYLVAQVANYTSDKIKIKILDLSWNFLAKDLLRAIEFDQSMLFQKVYSEEFGKPGGEPYGILVGDYYLSHENRASSDDIRILELLSKVAAAAFSPFVTAASPHFFGVESFAELSNHLNLEAIFSQQEYARWSSFRKSEEARFVGVVLPKILMRSPYSASHRSYGFCFREQCAQRDEFLWGNGAYAFASIVARAFSQSSWLADIRGVETDRTSGGVVTDLPHYNPLSQHDSSALGLATEVIITDRQEKRYSDLGFIPLCKCNNVELNAFYSCQSPKRSNASSNSIEATNDKLSSKLHYMLCVSRFAHYIKVIARDKVGLFINAEDCERYLDNWLKQYTAAGEDLSSELKAKYPLREGAVKVSEIKGKTGFFMCHIYLRPHYQIDQMESKLQLVTELIMG